jgi:hypothetical protein
MIQKLHMKPSPQPASHAVRTEEEESSCTGLERVRVIDFGFA